MALVRDVQARLEAERQMIELNRQLRMATEIGGPISACGTNRRWPRRCSNSG
ncbi:MAG: hypothetical protein U0704_12435 [Candidatus Eisenbacteria bacterium]